jgi:hypothetical protein
MSHTRAVLLLLAALALTVAWLFAASGIRSATGPPVVESPRIPPSPLDRAIDELSDQSGRLRRHLDAQGRLAPPRRDPFRFGFVRAPRPAGTAARPPMEAVPQATGEAAPPLRLVGIAEDRVADQTVRTAIIVSPDGLFLAEEGMTFGGRYRVERIGAAEAQVRDTVTGAAFTLSLR